MKITPSVNPFYTARVAARCTRSTDRIRYAMLPQAPLTASPIPELTSLYHNAEAGSYGDRGYPGNCGGNLIRDLLRFFRPSNVCDPMSGSGTCRDVCRALDIPPLVGRHSRGVRLVRPAELLRRVTATGRGEFRPGVDTPAVLANEVVRLASGCKSTRSRLTRSAFSVAVAKLVDQNGPLRG